MNDALTNNQKRTTPIDEQIDLEVKPIISDVELRYLYRKSGGDSDYLRRVQVVTMLRDVNKSDWDRAIERIRISASFSKSNEGSEHGG